MPANVATVLADLHRLANPSNVAGMARFGIVGEKLLGITTVQLCALNPDGSSKWRFLVRDINDPIPSIGFDGTIYFGGNKAFHAISPGGRENWKLAIVRGYAASRRDGQVLVACESYNGGGAGFVLINPDGVPDIVGGYSQSPNFAIGLEEQVYGGGFVLSPDLASIVDAGPTGPLDVAADHTSYAATSGGVYSMLLRGGRQWEFDLPTGMFRPGLTLTTDGAIYIGDMTGRVIALKASCGLAPSTWPMSFGNPKRNGRPHLPSLESRGPCMQVVRLAPDRGFQLIVRTSLGTTNQLQGSSDLADWAALTTFLQSNVTMHFTDPTATNAPHRFYRVKQF